MTSEYTDEDCQKIEIEAMYSEVKRLRTENEQLRNERKNCPPVSESEYVKRLEDDNFALAANQCHDGYAGEYGHHMCGEVEQLKAALRDDPEKWSWNMTVWIGKRLLDELYPADIFTGVSGDPGPTYIVALRNALNAVEKVQNGKA